jgi:hypothetical protein
MADSESKQNEKLKSQAEQMNLALESVHSEDQARELINGRIQDGCLLKVKVDIDNRTGVVMALISSYKKRVLVLYSLIGNSPILRKIRTFEDYTQLSMDFVEVVNAGGLDTSLSEIVGHAIFRALDPGTIESFLTAWEKNDTANTVLLLEQNILKNVRASRVKLSAEVDKISTVKFRHKNPMDGIVSPINPPQDETEEEVDEELAETGLTADQRIIENIVNRYSRELVCETILSPVNGIEFDNLVEGQEILFRLPNNTPQERATIQALELMDLDGKVKPVIGRFLTIVGGGDEYHILAEGPSNTILHSLEERPVKVAVPKKVEYQNPVNLSEPGSGNINLLIIAGAIAVFMLIMVLALI